MKFYIQITQLTYQNKPPTGAAKNLLDEALSGMRKITRNSDWSSLGNFAVGAAGVATTPLTAGVGTAGAVGLAIERTYNTDRKTDAFAINLYAQLIEKYGPESKYGRDPKVQEALVVATEATYQMIEGSGSGAKNLIRAYSKGETEAKINVGKREKPIVVSDVIAGKLDRSDAILERMSEVGKKLDGKRNGKKEFVDGEKWDGAKDKVRVMNYLEGKTDEPIKQQEGDVKMGDKVEYSIENRIRTIVGDALQATSSMATNITKSHEKHMTDATEMARNELIAQGVLTEGQAADFNIEVEPAKTARFTSGVDPRDIKNARSTEELALIQKMYESVSGATKDQKGDYVRDIKDYVVNINPGSSVVKDRVWDEDNGKWKEDLDPINNVQILEKHETLKINDIPKTIIDKTKPTDIQKQYAEYFGYGERRTKELLGSGTDVLQKVVFNPGDLTHEKTNNFDLQGLNDRAQFLLDAVENENYRESPSENEIKKESLNTLVDEYLMKDEINDKNEKTGNRVPKTRSDRRGGKIDLLAEKRGDLVKIFGEDEVAKLEKEGSAGFVASLKAKVEELDKDIEIEKQQPAGEKEALNELKELTGVDFEKVPAEEREKVYEEWFRGDKGVLTHQKNLVEERISNITGFSREDARREVETEYKEQFGLETKDTGDDLPVIYKDDIEAELNTYQKTEINTYIETLSGNEAEIGKFLERINDKEVQEFTGKEFKDVTEFKEFINDPEKTFLQDRIVQAVDDKVYKKAAEERDKSYDKFEDAGIKLRFKDETDYHVDKRMDANFKVWMGEQEQIAQYRDEYQDVVDATVSDGKMQRSELDVVEGDLKAENGSFELEKTSKDDGRLITITYNGGNKIKDIAASAEKGGAIVYGEALEPYEVKKYEPYVYTPVVAATVAPTPPAPTTPATTYDLKDYQQQISALVQGKPTTPEAIAALKAEFNKGSTELNNFISSVIAPDRTSIDTKNLNAISEVLNLKPEELKEKLGLASKAVAAPIPASVPETKASQPKKIDFDNLTDEDRTRITAYLKGNADGTAEDPVLEAQLETWLKENLTGTGVTIKEGQIEDEVLFNNLNLNKGLSGDDELSVEEMGKALSNDGSMDFDDVNLELTVKDNGKGPVRK